eukprot:2831980-Rhodomonas_salina.1
MPWVMRLWFALSGPDGREGGAAGAAAVQHERAPAPHAKHEKAARSAPDQVASTLLLLPFPSAKRATGTAKELARALWREDLVGAVRALWSRLRR